VIGAARARSPAGLVLARALAAALPGLVSITCSSTSFQKDSQRGTGSPEGLSCEVGVGACRRVGIVTRPDGAATVSCDAVPGLPAPEELCDLGFQDEDCDGLVNEDCDCIPGLSPDRPCGENKGECRPGWQRCVGGRYGSTCEQAAGPEAEICDSKDNDCNGMVDDVPGGCDSEDPCRPVPLPATATQTYQEGAPPPTCWIDDRGRMFMRYAGLGQGAYNACVFARGLNLEPFNSEHGGSGVLEVSLCFEEETMGGLNLWYVDHVPGDASKVEYRKYFNLVPENGLVLPGCVRRIFTPAMACFPGPWDGLPQACATNCKPPGMDCRPEFFRSELHLVAEYGGGTRKGAVTVQSVTYYPQQCLCREDADCRPGRYCRRHAADTVCSPDNGCSGVCARTEL
jgi:hypothetical protein